MQADRGYPGRGAGSRAFTEEQDGGDVLNGQGFRGCYPLDHIGERPGEVDHKLFESQGATKRSYPGDYLAYDGVAALRVVRLRFHSPHPHGQDSDTAAGVWSRIDRVATLRLGGRPSGAQRSALGYRCPGGGEQGWKGPASSGA